MLNTHHLQHSWEVLEVEIKAMDDLKTSIGKINESIESAQVQEEQKKDRFDRSQDLPPMEEILLGVRRIEVDSQPSGDEVFDEIDGKRKPRSHYKQRHDELHRNDSEKNIFI